MTTKPTVTAAGAAAAYDCDVCVVGLGPTGMTMAHLLAARGLTVTVLEREPEFYGMARAVYTDDECLRILQHAGVADETHADMIVDLPVQWVTADGSLLAQFREPTRPNGWPVSNFFYQPFLEGVLERRLGERPEVTIRRGRSVTGLEQDDEGVTLTHAASRGAAYGTADLHLDDSAQEHVRARYLVACDGGRSTVRTALGIDMAGTRFPQRWLVLDLRATEGSEPFAHLPYFDFVCDPELPTVSCPQPDRRHRFEFMLRDCDSTEEFEARATAERLLSRYVRVDEVTITRQLVYTFNALVADRWRAGRVFLAGDAAHMTPQFIGQGMNAGLRDAENLSWKLADVILRGAADTLLDTYESERKPHAQDMIRLSVLNKDIVSTGRPAAIRARDWGLGVATRMPGVRTYVGEAKFKPKPRFRPGSYAGLPRRWRGLRGVEGTLIPQVPLRTADGRPVRLDDALGQRWAVLGVGVDPRAVLTEPVWQRLAPVWARVFTMGGRPTGRRPEGTGSAVAAAAPPGLIDLEGTSDALSRWLTRAGARTGSVIVLRPDRHVFSVTPPDGHGQAVAALDRLLPGCAVSR
jgi:3-(3-hydroxy-phenyl)propionate hydroxylase